MEFEKDDSKSKILNDEKHKRRFMAFELNDFPRKKEIDMDIQIDVLPPDNFAERMNDTNIENTLKLLHILLKKAKEHDIEYKINEMNCNAPEYDYDTITIIINMKKG